MQTCSVIRALSFLKFGAKLLGQLGINYGQNLGRTWEILLRTCQQSRQCKLIASA
jgi:hypothetical protein